MINYESEISKIHSARQIHMAGKLMSKLIEMGVD